jgi:hypothetical protein
MDRRLVKVLGLTFDHLEGARRAFSQAGSQSVAILFRHQTGLPIHYLQSSFRTGGDALTTTVAELGIDLDYFTGNFHDYLLLT